MMDTLETLAQEEDKKVDVFGASLSRRGFVSAGGALLASFVLVRSSSAQEAAPGMRGIPTSKVVLGFVHRNSRRQYHPYPYRQIRLRPKHCLYGLPPNRGG